MKRLETIQREYVSSLISVLQKVEFSPINKHSYGQSKLIKLQENNILVFKVYYRP